MIKITAIAPYEELADLFREAFVKYNQYLPESEYKDEKFELEVIMAPGTMEVDEMSINSDVIIARGGIAYHLRQTERNIPIVEMPVVGNDLIHALHESKRRFECNTIAVVGPTNMTFGAERLSGIIGVDVKTFIMFGDDSIEQAVDLVKEQGIDTLIGGVKTCNYGNKLGLNTVYIKSGIESTWQAIAEAIKIAYISRREQEKVLRFKTIIDYAYEGVIAIDNQNKISVFNSAAQKILNINKQNSVGKDVDDVIPKSKLKDLLSMETICLDEIIKYNDTQMAINKVPIMLRGENVGNVLTFHDVTRIQELESKIREKIYTRGHIAKHSFDNIIGESGKLNEVIQAAKKFSRVESNVLVVGETGTGKELFAQSMHNFSHRKSGPFVAVNCAALPENLLESEMFGYVEGAFTGAIKGGKPGLFELAHRGTIFLDEISEISLKLQGQLLRVLQEKEIRRIGHDRIIPVDVRVISATNKELSILVQKGMFREDLYYRLDILKINIPPLRERKTDIPLLAKHFIREFQLLLGKEDYELSAGAIEALMSHEWSGNIRHLRNMCERLVVLSECNLIEENDIKAVILNNNIDRPACTSQSDNFTTFSSSSYMVELKQIEREKIKNELERSRYNKSKAAKSLGISRATLWRRMKEMNIEDLKL